VPLLPGPAGLLQAALRQGLLPAHLSNLSADETSKSSSRFLHSHDIDFVLPPWLAACRDAGVENSLCNAAAVRGLGTAQRLAEERSTRTELLLVIVDALTPSAGGSTFVCLKVRKGCARAPAAALQARDAFHARGVVRSQHALHAPTPAALRTPRAR